MPRSYTRVIVHTVFATKFRKPLINSKIEASLWKYITGLFHEMGVEVIRINGGFDHLHIVHNLPRTKSIAEIMKHVKQSSSKWMKQQGVFYNRFSWQEGYGCFSCDYRKLDEIIRYVDQQKLHHYGNNYTSEMRLTFEEEYGRILKAFGIDFDWDLEFPTSQN